MKNVIYALKESERAQYEKNIYTQRRMAIDYIKSFLKEKDPEEWVMPFSVLSELIGVLYHFEILLEEIQLRSEWDKKNNYWMVEDVLATRLLVYIQSALICKEELLSHGMSFSLH